MLLNDPTFGDLADVAELPRAVIERLRQHFLTYKAIPGEASAGITVDPLYYAGHARTLIVAARADYESEFAGRPRA